MGLTMSTARKVVEETAAEHGWERVNDQTFPDVIGKGDAQIVLGYSPSERTLQCAMYFPAGWRGGFSSDPRPFRSAPRDACLDVTLEWIRTGELDPPNPRRTPAIVIPCCARKMSAAAPAEKLYDSDHFRFTLRAARAHAEAVGATVWVLSARHGLVPLDRVIAPYDVTFGDPEAVTADWVYGQLCVFGISHVEALLPGRYLAVISEAVGRLHRCGGVMRFVDLYAAAAGIGYQRGVLAQLLRRATDHGDDDSDRLVS